MKNTIIAISVVIGLLELGVIIAYCCVFNGAISTANQDWDTFVQIFNGLVMAILTAVNIYIFYQLTVAIEDKNQERAVKEKVFEAQSVITQMRVKKYEEISTLIYDVLARIVQKTNNSGDLTLLMKKLSEIDDSLLFKNYHLDEPSMLADQSLTIIDNYNNLNADFNNANLASLASSLAAYLKIMETHIVGQMIIDRDVEAYVRDENNILDCTISCVKQVLDKALKELNKLENPEKES